MNEGRDFRVAAAPRTGSKQRLEEQRCFRAKRAGMALLAGAPVVEIEQVHFSARGSTVTETGAFGIHGDSREAGG